MAASPFPVADWLGARVAGFYEDRDGYVKHPGLAGGNYGGFNFPGYGAFESDDNNGLRRAPLVPGQ